MERLIIHGGAGRIREENVPRVREGLREALEAGWSRMDHATDAVVAAISAMEDSGIFDAGKGSVLNLRGQAEMDAALMTHERRAGAVANLLRVAHPIQVARKVMEETEHVMLAGRGANLFARAMGFPSVRIRSPERWKTYQSLRQSLRGASRSPARSAGASPLVYPGLPALLRKHPELLHGTVGAVALDRRGRLTAGTSTGGIFLKLEGRVSDSCLVGCGTYADEHVGISATGIGESIIRHTFARTAAERMVARRLAPSAALLSVLREMPRDSAGAIALDRKGRFGIAHNTRNLACAWISDREPVPHLRMS